MRHRVHTVQCIHYGVMHDVNTVQCIHDSVYIVHMGWLRLVGSLKLYVSFAEYSLFYRALLQKRPAICSDTH